MHGRSPDKKSERVLMLEDFGKKEEGNLLELLKSLYEMDYVKKMLEELGQRIKVRQSEGRTTTGLVGNFVFKGNPGTGKTTVAKTFGKILHQFGVLATDNMVETTALDLTAEYSGQTKEKVQKAMEAARGGVLFIDEAYELGKGSFGKEVENKILSMLTEDDYKDGKTIVIMAGYKDLMDEMLNRNAGLKSRFTKFVDFKDWDSMTCTGFVIKQLKEAKPEAYNLIPSDEEVKSALKKGFEGLIIRPGWANVRDAIRMIKDIESQREVRVFNEKSFSKEAVITLDDVQKAIQAFLESRPNANNEEHTSSKGKENREQAREQSASAERQTFHTTQKEEVRNQENTEERKEETPKGEEFENPYAALETQELNSINDVLVKFKWDKDEEKLKALLENGKEQEEVINTLVKGGMSYDQAKDVLEKYIVARKSAERLRKEMERIAKEVEKQRKPIIQCQVCKATADYWAPCWVAPMQIGWTEVEVKL
ncbi:MAG: AAA family ATPase [Leptospiraceae bacterium]|nr:AAA family ATPase [Leptospiraceae bacterium]